MVRRGGGLFKGRDYFKQFPFKGAIIRGTAIIRGNTVSMIFHLPVYKAPYLEKSIISTQHYRVQNSSQLTLKRTCSLLYGTIPEGELVFRREIHEDLSWELPNSNAPS